jgi:hypothetical protein
MNYTLSVASVGATMNPQILVESIGRSPKWSPETVGLSLCEGAPTATHMSEISYLYIS